MPLFSIFSPLLLSFDLIALFLILLYRRNTHTHRHTSNCNLLCLSIPKTVLVLYPVPLQPLTICNIIADFIHAHSYSDDHWERSKLLTHITIYISIHLLALHFACNCHAMNFKKKREPDSEPITSPNHLGLLWLHPNLTFSSALAYPSLRRIQHQLSFSMHQDPARLLLPTQE